MRDTDFSLIQNLVKCLSGMELRLFENRGELIEAVCRSHPEEMKLGELRAEMEKGVDRLQPGGIYEVQGLLELNYIIILDAVSHTWLVAGPCLLEQINEAEFRRKLREYSANTEFYDNILSFCRQFPQISYDVYNQLGTLLTQWFLDDSGNIPHQRVDYQGIPKEQRELFINYQYADLVQMRRVEQRYENSAALTEAVKCGNLSLAYQFMSRMSGEVDALSRNPDPLRNRKNMCIILNTQLRHALEGVGIHPYLLDKVSGDIALGIEGLRNIKETERFVMDIVRRYCELAKEHSYSTLKPFPHLAVTYVKNHLTENLTVRDTARALLVNPDYLSNCFHREVGMTFIDFVNSQRTFQAAGLLRSTNMQIQQIATLVGYNNTSYFAKQFARYYNMTPRDYRSTGRVGTV